jgi:predicted NUDIX family NTP pyrophosphohydrolase
MPKKSAGILAYRVSNGHTEFFLVHPGGPFWAKKDAGAWSIPKGEFDDEEALTAAKREFLEETGMSIDGEFTKLTPVTLKSGKVVHAWAVKADLDAAKVVSNTFTMEWPSKSGRMGEFPEVDRAAWFCVEQALGKINPAQAGFIRELSSILSPR